MIKSLKSSSNAITKLNSKIKFPEKFKDTVVEKWANYWKNLFIDYRQMLQDLRTDIQDNPKKALFWTAGLTAAAALSSSNPDEIEFKNSLKLVANEMALVSEPCQNPKSIEHIRYLEKCYNERVIHYRNLGILSVMYYSDHSSTCDLYKAQCSYLKPSIFSYPSRIVDIGLMGRWWNIFKKTANYDDNE